MQIFNTSTLAAVSVVRKLFISFVGVLVATVMVGSAANGVARDTVDLSIGPVAVNTQAVNIALALSVEWPTVGAAYRGTQYDHATTYLGYFDTKGCYFYKDISAGAPLVGEYFYRTGNVDASNFCNSAGAGTGYSGNLLNYVSTSTIDLLRYALTGGNRIVDTASVTVLDRAYLYNSWALHNGNFPVKRIAAAMVGQVTPNLGSAVGADIYAGSCLDRVWFGTNNAGANCDTPGTSGNLNALVADLSATTTVVVNPGAPAPANSIAGPVPVYEISSPRRTTTIAPTLGPISFDDVTVLGSGTSTTAPPEVSTSVSLITVTYVAKTGVGSTSTTAPPSTNAASDPELFHSPVCHSLF